MALTKLHKLIIKRQIFLILLAIVSIVATFLVTTSVASAEPVVVNHNLVKNVAQAPSSGTNKGGIDTCGSGKNAVKTKFNFDCQGKGNPVIDMLFSIIRFLSIGVGLVVVVAIILAGIQYSASEGNPEQTAKAKNNIQNAIFALLIYMFIFAILQYLVPGGLFNPQ